MTSPAPSRFAVIGQPVAHSLSPQIHAAFGLQSGIDVDYRRIAAPVDGFGDAVAAFFEGGGRGLNVTLPFKREAFLLCGPRLSARAAAAGAVNWLVADAAGPAGDTTDGIGLVRDLERAIGRDALSRARVLLVGAGGAARGVVRPLREATSGHLTVAARDPRKAAVLLDECGLQDVAAATGFDVLANERFDLVVNATSAALGGPRLVLPKSVFANARLAYDLMYAASPTDFLVDARAGGATEAIDGLGMLVEQAAESFWSWHGVEPRTPPVLAMLRRTLVEGK